MTLEISSDATDPNLDARVRSLINERLIAAYWEAAAHYKTGDLVVLYDHDEPTAIDFYRREKLIAEPDIPEFMRKSLGKPASSARSILTTSDAAFWLFASFSPEQMACVAVKAKRIGSPGNA